LEVVKVLIKEGKADYLEAGEDGSNCFHASVLRGHYSVVKYYIEVDNTYILITIKEEQVDVTVRRNEEATALHDAAVFGFVDVSINTYFRQFT
jgi:hypothetical protein